MNPKAMTLSGLKETPNDDTKLGELKEPPGDDTKLGGQNEPPKP